MSFVYIDALHDYDSVKADIAAWWPQVKPGGVLAGHDFHSGNPETAGVARAVREFAKAEKLHLMTTEGDRHKSSWYVVKPKA